MKYLLSLPFLLSILSSSIIHVPADFSTIQDGIDQSINGDTVLVQPGTYIENINFNGHNIVLASTYLFTADTTMIAQTTIDGNQNGSVVTFISGEDSTATLIGFTIRNGAQLDDGENSGGGIKCEYSNPTLRNLFITGNSNITGGGISFLGSNSVLTNVTITNNEAIWGGGGIVSMSWTQGSTVLRLNHVVITGNTSMNDWGGGLLCLVSDLIFNQGIISNNFSGDRGGGLGLLDANVNINDVKITDNSSVYQGGGMYLNNSTGSVRDVLISGNSSQDGGGIYSDSMFESPVNLENVMIKDNSAIEHGGGMYLADSSISFSTNNRCNINSNSVQAGGLGFDLYTQGSGIVDVIVDTFSVMIPTSYYASPIEKFSFQINDSVIDQIDSDVFISADGDDANDGMTLGTAFKTIQHAQSVILVDSQHQNIIWLANGVYSPSSNGEMFPINIIDYVTIIGESEEGVILDAENSGSVMIFEQIHHSIVSDLTVTGGLSEYGGGLYIHYNSSPFLSHITITGNSANFGGGIFIVNADPLMNNINIVNNSAVYSGGGISLTSDGAIFENIRVSDNTAETGGGINLYFANGSFTNLEVTHNSATRGGGINVHKSYLDIFNGTIADNTALEGGGIYYSYSLTNGIEITNSILWYNSPYQLTIEPSDYSRSVNLAWCDIQDGNGGIEGSLVILEDGNIDANPIFVDHEVGDYHLLPDSPCIDTGDPASPLDPDWTTADMGAYFYNQGPCEDSLKGDINGDGELNILDIISEVVCILSDDCIPALDPCELWIMDANNDSGVDILDVIVIVEWIVEL